MSASPVRQLQQLGNRLRGSDWQPLAMFGGAAFLLIWLALNPSLTWLLLPLAAIGGFLLWQNLQLGLLAIVACSLLVPFALGTGTETALHLGFLLVPVLFGIWLMQGLLRGQVWIQPSPPLLALLALIISATLSLIAGGVLWNPFAAQAPFNTQVGGWAIYVFGCLAFFLMVHLIQTEHWLKWLVGVFLGLAVPNILGRVFLTTPLYRIATDFYPTGSTGSLFWLWLGTLSGALLLFHDKLPWWLRVGLAALLAGTLWVLLRPVDRNWASGWAPLVTALVVLLLLRFRRAGILLAVLAVLGLLVSGLLQPSSPLSSARALNFGDSQAVEQLVLFSDDRYSYDSRLAAAQIIFDIIKNSPVFGIGLANYYWYTPLYAIFGWYVHFNSHNQYLDILAQTGWLGMVCFIWFIVAVGRQAWQLRQRPLSPFAQAYVAAGLAGVVGTLVACGLGDWFIPFTYNVGVAGFRSAVLGWLFLGGLAALAKIYTTPTTQS